MRNSVDNPTLTPDTPRMKNAEHMDRSDKLQVRKAERLIAQGGALVREGERLKRAVYQRLFMRQVRADAKKGNPS